MFKTINKTNYLVTAILLFIISNPLTAKSTQSLEFVVNMNGILNEIVLTDSLYKIHLDTRGHILQFSHITQGNIEYDYQYSNLDERRLIGPGIRWDELFRLGQIGTFNIEYDPLQDDAIEKIGKFDLYYLRTGHRQGEIEYVNNIAIRNKHRSNILDTIGDAIFFYRITDDKIEEIKGMVDENSDYRIRLILEIKDTIEQ